MTRSRFGLAILTSVSLLLVANPSISQDLKPDSAGEQVQKPMLPPQGDVFLLPPDGHPFPDHQHEPGFEPRPPFDPALHLANQLAGIETYVGITASQLDAWRGYTSALIDFVDARKLPRLADFGQGDGTGGAQPGKAPPLQAELLAQRSMAEAERAKTLKDEVDTLIATLSPEQLERLTKADRSLDLLGPGHGHGPGPFGPMRPPRLPDGR
ncbi:hypothetical protein [Neorhizobium sp. NCHU2750]|uniref:hypothetical protein n=1 Tax=Neorhizobium sp. NCHU2750 TaxID=1825976 RepID=UPI000E747F16|nr:hypothetical protein NCHU2750_43820 [Neorhizobium sp. NCHU2750]